MPSETVGLGSAVPFCPDQSRAPSARRTTTVSRMRALVVETGVEPARGNTTATTPRSTTPDTIALSVSDDPHGGTRTSSTATATKPIAGAIHSAAMARALTPRSTPQNRVTACARR